MPDRRRVTSADFIRNIGAWQNEALRQPISITHHGRERLVLATPEFFEDKASAASEAAFTALIENMSDGYLAFDEALNLTRANNAAARFLGLPINHLMTTRLNEETEIVLRVLRARLRHISASLQAETLILQTAANAQTLITLFVSGNGFAALLHTAKPNHPLAS